MWHVRLSADLGGHRYHVISAWTLRVHEGRGCMIGGLVPACRLLIGHQKLDVRASFPTRQFCSDSHGDKTLVNACSVPSGYSGF